MTGHVDEQEATWRDYCKHYGPCRLTSGDRCRTPDDPAYIADMERCTLPGTAADR